VQSRGAIGAIGAKGVKSGEGVSSPVRVEFGEGM